MDLYFFKVNSSMTTYMKTYWFNTSTLILYTKFDLVFTNKEAMVKDIKCLAPLGKSDHIGLSYKLFISVIMKIHEHEAKKLNYHKADYNKMNLLLEMTQWAILFKHKALQNM